MAVLTPCVTLAAAFAVLLGVRLHRPPSRTAWHLVALGLAMSATPGLIGQMLAPLYVAGELVIVVALVLLVRRRHGSLDRATLIDASIITLGFAAITWLYLFGPYADAATGNGIAEVWAPVCAAIDVLLVGSASLLLLGALRQGYAPAFFGAGTAALVGSHMAFLWSTLERGGHSSTGLEGYLWLAFCVLLGAAALCPSMRRLSETAERAGSGLTRGRLAIFAVTSPATSSSASSPASSSCSCCCGSPTSSANTRCWPPRACAAASRTGSARSCATPRTW
jgi:hypothetical protein